MANSIPAWLKERQIRLFSTDAKKSNREPDMSGKFLLGETLYHCALWNNVSRKTGKKFYKGLVHLDGQRGKNIGTIVIHDNKWYTDPESVLPIYFGRLKVNFNEFKLSLWIKSRDSKKPFYSGIIKAIS